MRIYIAEPHPLLRERVAACLGEQCAVSAVVAVESAGSLERATNDCEPDLVLLDLNLGDLQGVELLRFVKAKWPRVSLIVMLGMEDTFIRQYCRDAGAAEVVVKSEICNRLSTLVGAVDDEQSVKK